MTCLLFLSAEKAEQSNVPEDCMLKAPLTCFKAGKSTLSHGQFYFLLLTEKGGNELTR